MRAAPAFPPERSPSPQRSAPGAGTAGSSSVAVLEPPATEAAAEREDEEEVREAGAPARAVPREEPRMPLRCPLCWRVLDDRESLKVLCWEHAHKRGVQPAVSCGRDFAHHIKCGEPWCRSHRQIGNMGLFVAHVGCDARLKWSGVSLPLAYTDPDNPAAGPQPIRHWEASFLEHVVQSWGQGGPAPTGDEEMWFPFPLLLATSPALSRRRSACVELSGPRAVGKTVLAIQALDREGYIPQGSRRFVEVQDYIWASHSFDDLLRLLLVRSQMLFNQAPTVVPNPTPRLSRTVKAVFLRPIPRWQLVWRAGRGRIWPTAWALARDLASFGYALWRNLIGLAANRHCVVFVDTAGELSETPVDPYMKLLDGTLDAVCVLVDAREIWGGLRPQTSMLVASNRIQRVFEVKEAGGGSGSQRVCMVVTKLDCCPEIMAHPGVERIAENEHAGAERRQLVLDGVQKALAGDPQNATLDHFRQELVEGRLDNVFFVWTPGFQDLPAGARTIGLAPFVSWCVRTPLLALFGE